MRRAILILSYFFVVSSQYAQNPAKETRYLLTGRIISKTTLTPHCGISPHSTYIQFEIISFSDKAYKGKSIDIVISSPESFKADFFEPGKTYELRMSDQSKTSLGWAIPSEKSYNLCPTNYTRWLVSAKKTG